MDSNKKRTRKKKSYKALFFLLIVVIVCAFVFVKYINYKNEYKKSLLPMQEGSTETVRIIIPEQSSVLTIGTILEDNGLIRDRNSFRKQVKELEKAEKLKAGTFTISYGMNVDEIITLLSQDMLATDVIRVTIPEGFELRHIADRLETNNLGNKENFLELSSKKELFEKDFPFLKSIPEGEGLEGFLFPATYDLYEGISDKEIIEKMLQAFQYIYAKNIANKEIYADLNIYDLITMASIIEREARTDHDRPIIASVFYNRLKTEMPLQSCATIQYVLNERKPILSTEDTKIDSPYNTYNRNGLPKGPIASPGEKAILAALSPAETDYFYFCLTSEDGSHTFSKTFDEHEIARQKMLQP